MAEPVTIYHNPRCSKSRQALALLEEKGIEPECILYLKTPPTVETLRTLVQQFDGTVRDLLRTGEPIYKDLGLANPDLAEDDLLEAIAAHPRLLQRPIVVRGTQVVVGRPPERVLDIL